MSNHSRKSRWGVGLFFLYGGFVLFMLILVLYVSFQDMQLVEKDYYKKDLAYQDLIDKRDRAQNLMKIDFLTREETIMIRFSPEISGEITGTIRFFRPDGAEKDFQVAIEVDSINTQYVPAHDMARGLWRIKIDWMVDSVGYFHQTPLVVN